MIPWSLNLVFFVFQLAKSQPSYCVTNCSRLYEANADDRTHQSSMARSYRSELRLLACIEDHPLLDDQSNTYAVCQTKPDPQQSPCLVKCPKARVEIAA